MIYLFWLFAAPTAALAGLVTLLTLSGQRLSSSTPYWLSLLASAGVLALLWLAHRLATARKRPRAAILVVIASWLLFAGTMTLYGLMHQTIWN